MTVRCERVPFGALAVLAAQLEPFGANVHFETPQSGILTNVAGRLRFLHVEETLTIELLENKGHFPEFMIIGGIRQHVEEAVELFHRQRIATSAAKA